MRCLRKLMPVVCVMVLSAVGADAKSVQPGAEFQFGLPLADTSVECDVSNLSGALQCAGPFEGNDSNSILDDVFGSGAWEEIVKIDGGGSANGLTVSGSGSSGTWSYAGPLGDYSQVMVALKGGPSFSLYELDMDLDFGSGTFGWDTLGIVKGNGKAGPGLSHFSLYGREGDLPPPSAVPLPGPIWALLAGIGGLAALRKRASLRAAA